MASDDIERKFDEIEQRYSQCEEEPEGLLKTLGIITSIYNSRSLSMHRSISPSVTMLITPPKTKIEPRGNTYAEIIENLPLEQKRSWFDLLIKLGCITKNEIRALYDLPALAGKEGEEVVKMSNQVAIELLREELAAQKQAGKEAVAAVLLELVKKLEKLSEKLEQPVVAPEYADNGKIWVSHCSSETVYTQEGRVDLHHKVLVAYRDPKVKDWLERCTKFVLETLCPQLPNTRRTLKEVEADLAVRSLRFAIVDEELYGPPSPNMDK